MYLQDIVAIAKKRLVRVVHSFKWGHVCYSAAVGEVGGIIAVAEDAVCDIGFTSGASPTVITELLDELSDMQLEFNTKLREING